MAELRGNRMYGTAFSCTCAGGSAGRVDFFGTCPVHARADLKRAQQASAETDAERTFRERFGIAKPNYLSYPKGIPKVYDLPKDSIGPCNVPTDYTTVVFTISGAYFFKDEGTAVAFASRLISRGDELKVLIGTLVPTKSLEPKQSPDVVIEDLHPQSDVPPHPAITAGG